MSQIQSINGIKYVIPVVTGTSAPNDNNSCSVRALANATGCSLEESTKLHAKHGRKHNRGTMLKTAVILKDSKQP